MTHEMQCDIAIGNIKSKVNQTCYCQSVIVKHVTIRLKCGSGWSGSMERMGIKCVLLMIQRRSAYYSHILYSYLDDGNNHIR